MNRREVSMGLAMALAGCASRAGEPANYESRVAAGGGDLQSDIRLTKHGVPETIPLVADPTITDFVIVCHGWNMANPDELYEPLLANIQRAWSNNRPSKPNDRKYAFLKVHWPSRQYNEVFGIPCNETVPRRSRVRAIDVSEGHLRREVDRYAEFAEVDPAGLMDSARAVIRSGLQESHCADLMNELLSTLDDGAPNDSELTQDLEHYDPRRAQALLQSLSQGSEFRLEETVARQQGLSDPARRSRHRGPISALCKILNLTTFRKMKKRAGVVGQGLARNVVTPLAGSTAARIHLIGHSFGARLVTSAAYNAREITKVRSLTLLQGAFSQHAISQGGVYEGAYRNVSGPTLVTHTRNDDAVSGYYPWACRIIVDHRVTIGGPSDAFGAIGANGAQGLDEADIVAPAATCGRRGVTAFLPGKVHNINCDPCIVEIQEPHLDAHMNVYNSEVAQMVASALVS